MWGQTTCYCAPFRRHVYWAGYTIIGAVNWMSTTGGKRLAKGPLFRSQDGDKKPDDGDGNGEAKMPDDPMAMFGSIAIHH